MKINPEEISSIILKRIEEFDLTSKFEEIGEVLEAGDGVARIFGLSQVMAGELIEFESGEMGMVLNLEEDTIGAVILGHGLQIKEGERIKRTGRITSVPVGDALIGRVVDPLGRPLDGKGPIKTQEFRPIEVKALGVVQRQPVKEPLYTGTKAIDSMIPIGRGQRELIIGDRQTGKTTLAVDAIISQGKVNSGVHCFYVAIGQKSSTVARVWKLLEDNGAMAYTTIVVAAASDPAPLQFLAPYSGTTMGEYYRDTGRHSLVIYDDLSKHAAAYRQMSLLLRRPPGREAYPGDIFYLHSRLLERACKTIEQFIFVKKNAPDDTLDGINQKRYITVTTEFKNQMNEEFEKAKKANQDIEIRKHPYSGGSLTSLPIIETQANDISAYIPTNVISITDGQIYLDPGLFYSGIRPAIDVGRSVSRVGGNAQIKAMKRVAGSLRLDLAQFRSLAAFAQFGAELDKVTQAQLNRGLRMQEILKQGENIPLQVAKQVLIIFAGVNGYLDSLPIDKLNEYENYLFSFIESKHPEIIKEIAEKLQIDENLEKQVKAVLDDFRSTFA